MIYLHAPLHFSYQLSSSLSFSAWLAELEAGAATQDSYSSLETRIGKQQPFQLLNALYLMTTSDLA